MSPDLIMKILFAIVVNGFGVIVFWSFLYFKMGKKDNEYTKVIETFGLKKKYEDIKGKKVERKPSTVLRGRNYWLPLAFYTITCTIVSSLFLFPASLFGELFETETIDGITTSAKTFAHNPFFMGMYFGNLDISDIEMGNLSVADIQRRSIATLAWGFMGAFLWSASNMVRRLAKADITPILYYKASFRILFACAVALIFSFISGSLNLGQTGYTSSFVPAMAFMAGTLPDRFFNYLMELMKNILSGKDVNTQELHLKNIEGLSGLHRERLWEEGIDNAQNMAQSSLTQMLLKTPFEAREILDWVGQAKLLLYMKEDIGRAHAVGIRSVYDFISLKETYTKKGLDNMAALQELGQESGLNTSKLAVVAELVNEDLGVRSLKAFMDKLNGKKDDVAVLYENKDIDMSALGPKPVETVVPEMEIKEGGIAIPKDIPKSYE
jgi:hypothetical protein